MWKKLVAVLCFSVLLWTAALGEKEYQVLPDGLTLLNCSIAYPRVQGMADEELQQQINRALQEAGHAQEICSRIALAAGSGATISLDYTAFLSEGDILAVLYHAQGPLNDKGDTEAWYGITMDLRDGHIVTLEELTNPESLQEVAEAIKEELSPHLAACELEDLPETFYADASGILFSYPMAQYTTLQDRPGQLHVSWCEIDSVRGEQDGIPDRLGVLQQMNLQDRDTLASCVQDGMLPGVPARLGDPVLDYLPESTEPKAPDLYAYGRILAFENGAMRNCYLLTDAMTEDLNNSWIQGIRSDRIALAGLMTGRTTRQEWQAKLGKPDAELVLDEESAEAMRLVPGTSDYYQLGRWRLRLHANTDDVLTSLILTE